MCYTQILVLDGLIFIIPMTAARLAREQKFLSQLDYVVIVEQPLVWAIQIDGPQKSPYAGQKLLLEFKLTNFPFKQPKFKFRTKIFHPNVDPQGNFCCCFQQEEEWAPTKKMTSIINRIEDLLVNPQKDHLLHDQAINGFGTDIYQQRAKGYRQQSQRAKS